MITPRAFLGVCAARHVVKSARGEAGAGVRARAAEKEREQPRRVRGGRQTPGVSFERGSRKKAGGRRWARNLVRYHRSAEEPMQKLKTLEMRTKAPNFLEPQCLRVRVRQAGAYSGQHVGARRCEGAHRSNWRSV